jgi:hypothetical protein
MKYESVLWFTFAATLCFSSGGETALFMVSTAVSIFRAKCYQLQHNETAFCATAQNIQKIKL